MIHAFTFARVGEPFFIGVYVDGMLLAGKNEKHINEIKSTLARKFHMKDLGGPNHFLGVHVEQRHKMALSGLDNHCTCTPKEC